MANTPGELQEGTLSAGGSDVLTLNTCKYCISHSNRVAINKDLAACCRRACESLGSSLKGAFPSISLAFFIHFEGFL